MKRFLLAAAIALTAANTAAIAYDAGVSTSIGQPGFFGRLEIRDYPPPRLIYERLEDGRADDDGTSPGLVARASGPREKLAQTLPQIPRMRRAGLLCAGRANTSMCRVTGIAMEIVEEMVGDHAGTIVSQSCITAPPTNITRGTSPEISPERPLLPFVSVHKRIQEILVSDHNSNVLRT